MDWVFLLGRILIALVFALSALKFHLGGIGMTYAETNRVPLPRLVVPLAGLVMLAGAAMVAAGAWADLGALLLIAVLLPITGFMHRFWTEDDPQAKLGQQVHFFKNLGLAGGAVLVFFAYHELPDEAPLSATEPLFG